MKCPSCGRNISDAEILEDELNQLIPFFADCSICALCCYYNIVFTEQERKKINLPFEQKDGESCYFLRDNRCIIYDYRPSVCRRFPFEVKDDVVLVKDVEKCPASTGFLECFMDFCREYYPAVVFPELVDSGCDELLGCTTYGVVSTFFAKQFLAWLKH